MLIQSVLLECDCRGCHHWLAAASVDEAELLGWVVVIDVCICPTCDEAGRLPECMEEGMECSV